LHPGNDKFTVAEVLVEWNSPAVQLPEFPGPASDFKTAKGVRLGISPGELVAKLGDPGEKGENVYRYRVEFNQYILEKYNMPIYYGDYTFARGALVRFRFGFEYP
jgi:hypothetical protein